MAKVVVHDGDQPGLNEGSEATAKLFQHRLRAFDLDKPGRCTLALIALLLHKSGGGLARACPEVDNESAATDEVARPEAHGFPHHVILRNGALQHVVKHCSH